MTRAPAIGHHAFAAEYDVKKPVTVNGVVTKMAVSISAWKVDS